MYKSLRKLYYQLSTTEFNDFYQQRFNGEMTEKLPFAIKEINRRNSYPTFFCYCKDLSNYNHQIRQNLLILINIIQQIPPLAILQHLRECLIDEIKFTNDIEGVKSTRKEIHSALQITQDKNLRFRGIVDKYLRIIGEDNIAFNTPEDIRLFYDDFIKDEILRDNPANLPDGKLFRKDDVEIGTLNKKPVHRGIHPEEEIIVHLEKALTVLHNEEIDPLISLAIFHYLFGYIHPFYDGNGRINRFITSYYLAKYLHPTIALSLSLIIKKERPKYYELFEHTTSEFNRGDLTPFIINFLEFIISAMENTISNLKQRLELYQQLFTKLSQLPLYKEQSTQNICKILLEISIFSNLAISNKDLAELLDKNPRTITAKLKTFPTDLLITKKYNRITCYQLNLDYLTSY